MNSIPSPGSRQKNAGELVDRSTDHTAPMVKRSKQETKVSQAAAQVWKGLPMEGPEVLRKKTDPDPTLSGTPHAEVFDLSKEDQIKKYESCLQKIAANANTGLILEDRQFSPLTGNFMILLRYNTYFYTPAEEKNHD